MVNKQFFTWVPFNWNNGSVHVGTHLGKNWNGVVTVSELSYSGRGNNDARYLGVIEGAFPTGKEEQFKSEGSVFGVTFITESKVSELLGEWYSNGEVTFVNGEFVEDFPETVV